ncbi:hypothetical protein CRG98_018023 [Punica granatum]|uniref:Uncharacterized protein n=1 Tax=Punica granatum TaxID=22663 RepID=A0A2I0JZ38_PUNGR|nr:hypothetical protein CRG98_018023 [Punica granatum]
MTPLLATYDLLDHVEGRATALSKTIVGADGVQVSNPDYLRWESRDNFAFTCVMLAVTEAIGVTILTARTSHEAWTSLERAFEHALRYAQIGKPKNTTEINPRIYTGLGPEWEPIVLAQFKRMLTISTNKLQLLLDGHEERRLYATTHGAQAVNLSSSISVSAFLSSILGTPLVEVHYINGRNNQSSRNKGKSKGGKGNGKGRGSGPVSDRNVGRKNPNQGSGREDNRLGSGYVNSSQSH